MSKLNTSSFSWLVRRLRAMPFGEILYRIKLELLKRRWKRKIPSYSVLIENDLPKAFLLQPDGKDLERKKPS